MLGVFPLDLCDFLYNLNENCLFCFLVEKKRHADIGVIIDTPFDFKIQDFGALQQIVVNLAETYNSSQFSNRIGTLFFSNERWKTMPLNEYFRTKEFENTLKGYQLMNNVESVEEKLKLVYDKLLGPNSGARVDVPKLIILLTHENALQNVNPEALVESMKPIEKAGIRVIVGAVGKTAKFPHIKQIIKSSAEIFTVANITDALQLKFAKAISDSSVNMIGKCRVLGGSA